MATNVDVKQPVNETEKLQMQIHLIDAMRETFEKYLEPTKIILRLNGLDEELKERIHDKESNGERREAVRMLLDAVRDQNLSSEFVQILKMKRFERFMDVLNERKIPGDTQIASEYCEFLVKLLQAEIIENISNPIVLLPDLLQKNIITEEDSQNIRVITDNRGAIKGSIQLLKCIPRQRSDWPFDFFQIMQKYDPAALIMIEVDPVVKAATYGTASAVSGPGPASQPGDGDRGSDRRPPPDTTGTDDGDEDFSDSDEKLDQSGEKDLQMREYQYELSAVALNGENTIICAPTGSGKTRVSLFIVRDHLSRVQSVGVDGSRKKIVFLAKTTPLVNQQAKTFQKYLPPEYSSRICHVTGESELSMQLHNVFSFYDIFVLTPQILDNHLNTDKIKSLSEFSLMILDECHHTRKGEPYNNLMKKYLKAKKEGDSGLPQIIGLTASLGVEKATTVAEATVSVIKLCANLDVYKLSTVVVNKEELLKTVPVPDERRMKLQGNRSDEARKELHKTMIDIESHLEEAIRELGDRELLALKKKRPSDLNSQSYGQWAVELKRTAMKLRSETPEAKALTRTIVVTARQLEVYNASMDIHDLVRLSDVLDYLEKSLPDNLEKNKHSVVEAEIASYFSVLKKKLKQFAIQDENPNLKILKDVIIKLRREKGADSLGIIFVRTRATCYAICEWMKSVYELRVLNAEPFTGAGAHEDEGGMTQNQQDAAIERFKNGTTKFLVATSVAEEGLDIPECNIVIRYNHVGNEITTVQTRGRSRKKGGTSMLLGYDEVIRREMLNVGRSKMMEEAIIQFREMRWKELSRQIKEHQKNVIQEEEMKEKISKLLEKRKISGHFKLLCIRCQKLSIDNEWIRTINKSHHVVIDPEFITKVDFRPDTSPRKPFDGIQITGKMHCKHCHNHLGIMFRYRSIMFPAIRIGSFQFVADNGAIELPKKWKDVPYKVLEIQPDDYNALLRQLSMEKEQMDAEEMNVPDNDRVNESDDDSMDEESDIIFPKEIMRSNREEKDMDETEVKRHY